MTTHTVARNAHPARIQLRERLKHNARQLLRNIAVHIIALVVRGLGSIHVKARARTKVISFILALDVQTACRALITETNKSNHFPIVRQKWGAQG